MTLTSPSPATWPVSIAFRSFHAALFGAALGLLLSRVGFTDFGEFHRMLRFEELRLFLVFAGSLVLSALGFAATRRVVVLPQRHIHKGSIAGGVIFGVGWALCGACPSVAFSQLGEGRTSAAWTIIGMIVGARVYPAVHARWFRFDRGACRG